MLYQHQIDAINAVETRDFKSGIIFDNEGNNILTKAIYPLVCCDFNNKY